MHVRFTASTCTRNGLPKPPNLTYSKSDWTLCHRYILPKYIVFIYVITNYKPLIYIFISTNY